MPSTAPKEYTATRPALARSISRNSFQVKERSVEEAPENGS